MVLAREQRHSRHAPGRAAVTCLMRVTDDRTLDTLRTLGVRIHSRIGTIITATVPRTAMGCLERLCGVGQIDVATPMQLTNDSARVYSHVDEVHAGLVSRSRTGRGVVVGVIDTGVDFNHINLCDESGQSRVRAAYLPADTTGTPPVVDAYELPGSHYDTPDAVAALTTDYASQNHGTHTTGTAAGSCTANGLHGVAPDADLVICAMPSGDLTDANIVHGLHYIFDYAARHGQPCVVNLSLGNTDGPHNGTSLLCQVMDALSGEGRVCVLSAGNDGNKSICLYHEFGVDADELRTIARGSGGSAVQFNGAAGAWSIDGDVPHHAYLNIIDVNTLAVCYSLSLDDTDAGTEEITISSDDDATLAAYYDGELYVGATVEDNGMYHSVVYAQGTLTTADYALTIAYTAPVGTRLRVFGAGLQLAGTLPGYQAGNATMSISDLATGDRTLSVGAYCTRANAVLADGSISRYYSTRHLGEMADFSSYGPDARGIERPDVVAPGYAVVSSSNHYFEAQLNREDRLPAPVVVGEERYPYVAMWGTSMATPVVTGAVALMLEANPRLTPEQARQLLTATADLDDYVTTGNPHQWGAGKLNVAALMQALDNTLADVNADGEVNAVDIAAIVNVIAGLDALDRYDGRADVTRDGAVNAVDIAAVVNAIAH